jgi:hypothetical protein
MSSFFAYVSGNTVSPKTVSLNAHVIADVITEKHVVDLTIGT